jgi:S1-C subfamily serine protease
VTDDRDASTDAIEPMTGELGPPAPPPSAPPPPAPPKRRPLRIAAAVVVAVAVFGAGIGLGAATRDDSAASNASPTATHANPPSSRAEPLRSSDGLATDEIAARVDPAIVDINTTLPGGQRAAGTGMVIDASGVVLTNNHVIEDATTITVRVIGSSSGVRADVIGADTVHDVAVLQMRGGVQGLATVTTGSSSGALIGDRVVAIGNALGRGGTPSVTEGVVSATDQTLQVSGIEGNPETLHGMIQMNAEIQPGDSGGPLVDTNGRVIGMTTAASAETGLPQKVAPTVGFAIPIDQALSIARDLRTGGSAGGTQSVTYTHGGAA